MKKELKNKKFGETLYNLAKKYGLKLNGQLSIENILLDAVVLLLEEATNAEMNEHLKYNKHQETNFENSRNGYSSKDIQGFFAETRIKTLSDKYDSFESVIIE